MKLISCQYQNQRFVGIVEAEIALLPALDTAFDQPAWRDMLALIDSGIDLPNRAYRQSATIPDCVYQMPDQRDWA